MADTKAIASSQAAAGCRVRIWSAGRRLPGVATICLAPTVLRSILSFSGRERGRECGGFLIGRAGDDAADRIDVWGFVPAAGARGGTTSLTFTHDAWKAVNRVLEDKGPPWCLVGWQHTHPKLGVFLSTQDVFIHHHFFARPWQIAMVVDPVKKRFGFFQWFGGEVVSCGFQCEFGS